MSKYSICTFSLVGTHAFAAKWLIKSTFVFGLRRAVSPDVKRSSLLAFLTLFVLGAACFLPPIHQSPLYHHFANHSRHLGIANFWNVGSNLAFLVVAALAWPRRDCLSEPWQRRCFRILVLGVALTSLGSAYYHWQPSEPSLFWDRLPMTIVFMCILIMTIGERIDGQLGNTLLWPLLVIGVSSAIYWRLSGDLRPYAVVQFYPMIVIPLMLIFWKLPTEQKATSLLAQWLMIAFYGVAKIAEFADSRGATMPFGAHAWKHIFAAVGLLIYTQAVTQHADLHPASPTCRPSASFSKRTSPEPPLAS